MRQSVCESLQRKNGDLHVPGSVMQWQKIIACLCVGVVLIGCGRRSGATGGLRKDSGVFQSVHGQTGKVHFSAAFTAPPKVTLKAGKDGRESRYKHPAFQKTMLVETTDTYFQWRNTGKEDDFADDQILWEAEGR